MASNSCKTFSQGPQKLLKRVPKKSRTGKAINDRDTNDTKGSERQEQTLEWMKIWVGHYGCLQPDSPIVYIYDVPMDDMWKEYCEEMRDLIDPLGSRQFR